MQTRYVIMFAETQGIHTLFSLSAGRGTTIPIKGNPLYPKKNYKILEKALKDCDHFLTHQEADEEIKKNDYFPGYGVIHVLKLKFKDSGELLE